MVNYVNFKYEEFYKICNLLFTLTDLDIKLMDQEGNILLELNNISMPESLQKSEVKYSNMMDTLQKHSPESYYYHTNSYGLDYITVGIWRNNLFYGALMIGPFLETGPDHNFITKVISTNNLQISDYKPLKDFYNSLAIVNSSRARSIGTTLVNLCNNTLLTPQLITSSSLALIPNQEKTKDQILNSIDIIELRNEKESVLMDAISRGKKEQIKKLKEEWSDASLDKRIPESPIRSYKNLLIVLNTLCRIAAKNGGVHSIYIHSISEKFAILIERAPNLPYLYNLRNNMLDEYCDLVAEYSTRKYSAIVQKAVNYIKMHLESPLTLQGIAETIHVNDSHLSRKFKEDTGMSLIDYINLNRIEAAKVHLQLNTSSITEIGFLVGFNDVNYFSRVFKKVTGLTPSQYRKKLSADDEIE